MKKFVKAVLITTILAVITRALGLLIKIYLSRVIGAEAIGYYQIALSVFFLLCSLVTSGIPLVVSRKVSSSKKDIPKIVFSGLIVSASIGIIVCAFVFLFPFVITNIWGQTKSLSVLFALLPAVIFTSLYVPFRGAFWGNKNFFTLGFIELIEQIFRFVSCFILFSIALNISGEMVAGITYSIACGGSSIVAIVWYFIIKGKIKPNASFIFPIIKESAPIAIMRIGSSVTTLLISIIMPLKLISLGLQEATAVSEYGVVTGMVLPLLTIPGTLISSIAVALIPDISSATFVHTKKQINRALNYSIIISFILFPTFLVLGKDLGLLLYNDALSGTLLSVGSVILLPLGISQISSSILNAIGKEKFGLISYTIGAVLLITSILVLGGIIGIYSLLIGFLLMSLSSSILNLIALKKYLNVSPIKTLSCSLIYSIISGLFAYFIFGILKHFASQFIACCIASGFSILVLLVLYNIFKFVDIKDFLPTKVKKPV